MKGGYQILDLTGATAGSPVEVKGIYKAAAGNNGKPVLILTNDGQRVYAEIAEDGDDFITCYISAEGKTVNITIEPDDSVTTVISDPGASITGLEQAVNELNGNKAAKSDITDLECTGTKNTTGNTIAAGRYFYLNGALCKATADIANGATFTLNTNFAVVTIDEELSALNSNLTVIKTITGSCTKTQLENGYAVAYPTGMNSSKMMVIGIDVSPSTGRWDALSNSYSSSYKNHGWDLRSSGILITSGEYGTGSDSMGYRIAYIEL